jgi:hypothetical protein
LAIIGMPIIMGMFPHIIIMGMPMAIIFIMASQRSLSMSMLMPSMGIILQTMPSLPISMLMRTGMGIIIDMGMGIVIGICIGIGIGIGIIMGMGIMGMGMPPCIIMPGIMPGIMFWGIMPGIIIGGLICIADIMAAPPSKGGTDLQGK